MCNGKKVKGKAMFKCGNHKIVTWNRSKFISHVTLCPKVYFILKLHEFNNAKNDLEKQSCRIQDVSLWGTYHLSPVRDRGLRKQRLSRCKSVILCFAQGRPLVFIFVCFAYRPRIKVILLIFYVWFQETWKRDALPQNVSFLYLPLWLQCPRIRV